MGMGEGWRPVRLGEIAEESRERFDPSNGEERPYIGLEHLESNTGQITAVGSSRDVTSAKTVFRAGDTLFGKLRPYLRKVAQPNFDGVCSTDILAIRPRPGTIPEYLSALLASEPVIQAAVSSAAGTKMPRTSWRQLSQVIVPHPPLHEQHRIAEIIGSVDEATQATRAVVEQTRKVKQGMLQELLTRGIGHTRFKQTEIGEVPEGWEVTTLGEAGTWSSGGTPTKSRPDYWDGEIPWISPKDMKKARIDDSSDYVTQLGAESIRTTPAGSVLVVVRGMILAHSVPVAVVMRQVAFNQDIKALAVSDKFLPQFILYWFQFRSHAMLRLVDAASHGTKRIPMESLLAEAIPCPPLSQQERIVEILSQLDGVVEGSEVQLRYYANIKRTLIGSSLFQMG